MTPDARAGLEILQVLIAGVVTVATIAVIGYVIVMLLLIQSNAKAIRHELEIANALLKNIYHALTDSKH